MTTGSVLGRQTGRLCVCDCVGGGGFVGSPRLVRLSFLGSGCVFLDFGPSVLSYRPSPPVPLPWKKFERGERDTREERGERRKESKTKTKTRCNGHTSNKCRHTTTVCLMKETRRGESASSRDIVQCVKQTSRVSCPILDQGDTVHRSSDLVTHPIFFFW